MWALAFQVAIVVATIAVTSAAVYLNARDQLRNQYGQRALAVGRTIAQLPFTVEALESGQPGGELQELVERIRVDNGLTYIVVGDLDGIRFTHPNPDNLGLRVSTSPADALAGDTTIVVETGTLGETMRAKLPVFDGDGEIVGFISAGIATTEIGAALNRALFTVLACGSAGLAAGLAGSWVFARRLRRATRGLAATEIATLHEHREAMLLSLREGVVTLDPSGTITLINTEAQRLLGIAATPPEELIGQRLTDLVTEPGIARIAVQPGAGDQTVINQGRLLVASHRPVTIGDDPVGSVLTLRDRTELQHAVGELQTAKRVTDSLRAQAHEHLNRMHTVAGLIELGHTDEALAFIMKQSRHAQSLTEAYQAASGDPTLVALLLAKSADAAERGVDLRLTYDPVVQASSLAHADDVVTAVGNLVDNAFDAATAVDRPPIVALDLTSDGTSLIATVADSGAGVPDADRRRIHELGFSTKGVNGRGIGLTLVNASAERHGGRLELLEPTPDGLGGAVFRITLPDMLLTPVGTP